MKRLFVAILITFLSGASLHAQMDFSWYKNIYACADSLNQKSSVHPMDTVVYSIADSLDSLHPSNYFLVSGQLLKENKFNEAAFLYHLGVMRYRYYNSVNPAYQASEDGALFTSLRSILKESMDMYLRTSVNNYVFILRRSCDYHSSRDYQFCPKGKDIAKYEEQSDNYEKLAAELETDKAKYAEQWRQERMDFENMMNAYEESPDKK
jgi:hypothetical protein